MVLCIAPTFFSALLALLAGRSMQSKNLAAYPRFRAGCRLKIGNVAGSPITSTDGYSLREVYFQAISNRVSTISKNMLQVSSEKGVSPERARLLLNWVDTKTIQPLTEANPLRTESGMESKKIIVLYHGNMGLKQGLEGLIEAAARLQDMPDLLFLLCGEGPMRRSWSRRPSYFTMSNLLNLQPSEKLNQLVNLADIHVFPQRAGVAELVMPSKLTTMLASGKAVIATADENTEIGRDGKANRASRTTREPRCIDRCHRYRPLIPIKDQVWVFWVVSSP